jgi:N-acetylglutamate synthase-like GNAT family acetyltransferase
MNKLHLKLVADSDAEEIFQLLRGAAEWLRRKGINYWQNWHSPPKNHVCWIMEGIENREFYLVEYEGESIGCFRLQWQDSMFWGVREDDAGYIHSFTTRRDLAGNGIGRRILELIEARCIEKGKKNLRLDCGTSILELCRYYESCGFTSVGEVIVGGEQLTLYEKKLTDKSG